MYYQLDLLFLPFLSLFHSFCIPRFLSLLFSTLASLQKYLDLSSSILMVWWDGVISDIFLFDLC